ncbi:hypothetical protein Anas_05593 [Armadillidium nasatum]|uniref:Uncharacterized protein n=1 Tax=Armadillidium nasatum TaxID=96803 RepID=A0A5N5SSR3_9CRUS|nr:hypothetical protein Anas_05593 [Armadillidium nasatum]
MLGWIGTERNLEIDFVLPYLNIGRSFATAKYSFKMLKTRGSTISEENGKIDSLNSMLQFYTVVVYYFTSEQ